MGQKIQANSVQNAENQDSKKYGTRGEKSMSDLKEYKCPACGGAIEFDSHSQKMKCPYCDTEFDLETLKKYDEQLSKEAEQKDDISDWQTDPGKQWQEGETDGMNVYTCKSCGGEIVSDENTGATSCPYCGNPNVVPGQFSGTLRPDFVLPFKLSKENAVKALKKYYRGKFFLPRSFTSGNHIQEIKGIYVPFWMFDGEAVGDARYEATRSHTYRSGDYKITETEHYDVYRSGAVAFEKIPVDASSKMPDDYMDSIEPYDYTELKPFSTAYLPGFLADKFDITVEQSRERADGRCENTLSAALRDTVKGYDFCHLNGGDISLKRGKVHYALLPVWILNTRWNDKDFLFAMNGQTGKLAGELPVSNGKFWALFFAIAVPLSVLSSVWILLL